MQKVISINLNGTAYQLEEPGYDILREYLASAERELHDNPDRAEIMADLEQAVAEKCHRYLTAHKTVVTAGEIDQIVAEMGPVNDKSGAGAERAAGSEAEGRKPGESREEPRRLYRIPEGAVIAGVCNGVAAYLQVDVTIVRVAFLGAAIVTKGVAIAAYVIMMFVLPEANTPRERAAAGGTPFNAKDVIDRARKQSAAATKQWRRHWRQQRRHWRWYGWSPGAVPLVFRPPLWAAVVLPVFGLVHVTLFLIMAVMMVSLVNTGEILSWPLPPDVPVWAAAVILLIAYQILVSPLRTVQSWTWSPRAVLEPAPLAFWSAAAWLVGVALVMWVASDHTEEIREFLHRLVDLVRDVTDDMRNVPR